MPHIVLRYTANLDEGPTRADVAGLCRRLADTLAAMRDEDGSRVFSPGGVRVMAYPAPYFAVGEGSADTAFVHIHLRMGRGRSQNVRDATGDALRSAAHAHLAPLLAARSVGLTLQIEESREIYSARFGNLHRQFGRG